MVDQAEGRKRKAELIFPWVLYWICPYALGIRFLDYIWGNLMTAPSSKKIYFFLSPYAKVFSRKLEHGISIRTCPLHVEIPNHNLFYVQGAGKIFGSNRDPLLERGMAKLTC